MSAKVMDRNGTDLYIHYMGFNASNDVWSSLETELHLFAEHQAISKRPAHRMKQIHCEEVVDIRDPDTMQWTQGVVSCHVEGSGEVEVKYGFAGTENHIL